ncbi:hypothetical protein O6H91_22G034000 [Diphasiastrum complanatum]|uniref:Uncharacterized protein n=1 Tax=Diphasiastrum complanatum TaxID=34168 RepID=A0ACC2AE94_DIPCM|nr:hypothetical protein O6H91_22G034000 [Diphasiastrum complanatum]
MGAVGEAKRDAKAVGVVVMDAGAALCEHLQRQGLHSHLFSDIVLNFQGKDYALHRIVLSQSYYFHSLLSGPWKENGKPRVELKIDDVNVTPQGLEMAFDYLYGLNPVLSRETVVSVLAGGCFLCLEKLCERCVQFMVENLGVDTFLDYQQLSEQHCYGRFADRIRNACWTFLCTHASRELVNVLPKLSLPILCRLLQSDELWVPTELERYKLAKQAFIEWVLARMKPVIVDNDCSCTRRLRGKSISNRKHTRSVTAQNSSKGKASQKSGRCSNKDRGSKKETPMGDEQKEAFSLLHEDVNETTLKRLRSLWESAAADQTEIRMEDFRSVAELFTGGGIVFAHMEAEEVLQVRKELEDASFSTAAADESIWQHVLLKSRVLTLREPRNNARNESSDDEEEEMEEDEEDDDEDDEDEVDEEDEEDHSERDSSDSDGWSSDRSSQEEDESNSSDARAGNAGNGNVSSSKRSKLQSTALVCFNSPDGRNNDISDKRRKTSGGFSWIAKPDTNLLLADFPPFRFGAEFILKDKRWTYVSDSKCAIHKAREVFYGGSLWKIFASNTTNLNQEKEGWLFGVHCRPVDTWEPHTYQDNRKKVRFVAKVYIKTNSGLSCVTGTGLRKRRHLASSFKNTLGMNLFHEDVILDEPLRVSAVVQLIED